jgi:hypothetical protein
MPNIIALTEVLKNVITGPLFDPDAQAFITAAGITNATQQNAINTLVLDLKSYGLYTKMQAAYPMVGGTATTHKYNLINPVDTDAGFRLGFAGGITHDADGVTFNGTNGYAYTYFFPAANYASKDSAHLSVYNRSSSMSSGVGSNSGFPLGCRRETTSDMSVIQFDPGRVNYSSMNSPESLFATESTLQGMMTLTRRDANYDYFKLNTDSVRQKGRSSSTTLPNVPVTLAGRTNGTSGSYSVQASTYTAYNCAWASIGTGFTDQNMADLYTVIQAYQTALSRNV